MEDEVGLEEQYAEIDDRDKMPPMEEEVPPEPEPDPVVEPVVEEPKVEPKPKKKAPTKAKKRGDDNVIQKLPDGSEVVRPKPTKADAATGGRIGSLCVECGRWEEHRDLPWCRACGGKIVNAPITQKDSLMKSNMKKRGML